MLRVNGIDVFYGDLQVLWDVSFEVKDEEIVVLVGANGAGKSTTIRTVSALLTPRKGSIEFDGVRIDQTPAYRVIEHGIVHVPEGRRLFPQMSVEENLIMGSLHGEAKAHRSKTMERVYSLFPRLERAQDPAGRDPLRRRAADAGDRPGSHVAPQDHDVRRAIARTGAHPRVRRSSAWSARSTRRESRFCSSSRT